MPKRKELFETADDALNQISNGLIVLDTLTEGLASLDGSQFVDVTAKLNASGNKLDKILEPLKEKIKGEALMTGLVEGESVIPGDNTEAVVTRFTKQMLDGEAVKQFLGRQLSKYLKKVPVVQVSFRVRG